MKTNFEQELAKVLVREDEDEEEKTTRDVNVYFETHDTDLTEGIREYTTIITDVELL